MYAKLAKDSVYYAVSLVLTRGLFFLLLPFYTHVLEPAEFGLFDYITVLGSFTLIILTLEISQALGRFVPEIREDGALRRAYASTAILFTITVYIIFDIAVFLLAEQFSQLLFQTQEHATLLRIASLSFTANALVYVLQSQLRGELRAKHFAFLSILNAGITVATIIPLVFIFKLGVAGILTAQAFGGLCAILYGIFLTRNSLRFKFDKNKFKEMLLFSLPFVPSTLGVIVTQYADRIAINDLMSLKEVGIYGVGNRISMFITLAVLGVQGALSPLIYANYKDPDTPNKIATIFRVIVVLALTGFLAIVFLAGPLVSLFATEAYSGATTVLPLLALAAFFRGGYMFTPGLDIAKRTVIIATINILAAILNVVLNYMLIPEFGIRGAALATTFSTLLLFITYAILSHREYPIAHKWAQYILCLILVVVVSQIWYYAGFSVRHATFFILGSIVTFIAMLHLTKLVTVADLILIDKTAKKLLNRKKT